MAAEMLTIQCPGCSVTREVPQELLASKKTIKCPGCGVTHAKQFWIKTDDSIKNISEPRSVPPQEKAEQYSALRIISTILEIVAILVALASLVVLVLALGRSEYLPEAGREIQNTLIRLAFEMFILRIIAALILFALAKLIILFIDIANDIRAMKESVKQAKG